MDNPKELSKQREAINMLQAKLADLKVRVARLEVAERRWEFERRRLRILTSLSLFLSLGAAGVALASFANFAPLLNSLEQAGLTSLGTIAGYVGALAALAVLACYSNLTNATNHWYQVSADVSEGRVAIAEAERLLDFYGRRSEAAS